MLSKASYVFFLEGVGGFPMWIERYISQVMAILRYYPFIRFRGKLNLFLYFSEHCWHDDLCLSV